MKRKMRYGWLAAVLGLLLVSAGCAQDTTPTETKDSTDAVPKTEARKMYDKPPAMQIDPEKSYTATIVTEEGNLELELFAKDVPNTVNNFVFLARDGFYNDTTFHRVIAGFMAQAGDPTGSGRDGPGYQFADEFTQHGHGTGTLSMANAGPGTNGSQFFITYTPQPSLDGRHSVFGQLTAGMDVLLKVHNGTKLETITIQER